MEIVAVLTIGSDRIDSGVLCIKSLISDGVKVAILWRGEAAKTQVGQFPVLVEFWVQDSGLSKVRNLLISNLFNEKLIEHEDIICFADDDGIWPTGMAPIVHSCFDENIDWAIGTYGNSKDDIDRLRFPTQNEELTTRKICDRASSLGLYIRASALWKVGKFQESLGVGTDLPIGEDTEYMLRAAKILKSAPYRYRLYQIHTYSQTRRMDRIVPSFVFLARHASTYPMLLIPLLRGIAGNLNLIGWRALLQIMIECVIGRSRVKHHNWDQ